MAKAPTQLPSAQFVHSYEFHTGVVSALQLRNKVLYTTSLDGSACQVDLEVATLRRRFKAQTGPGVSLCLTEVSPDCFWVGCLDGFMNLFDMRVRLSALLQITLLGAAGCNSIVLPKAQGVCHWDVRAQF